MPEPDGIAEPEIELEVCDCDEALDDESATALCAGRLYRSGAAFPLAT